MTEELKAATRKKAAELREGLKSVMGRLMDSERQLWSQRLDEVALWQSVHPIADDEQARTVRHQIGQVLERRAAAVADAIEKIASIDETYAALKHASAAAEDEVVQARARFDAAEADVLRRLAEDPAIVALDREEGRLMRIRNLNGNWQEDLEALVNERLSEYNADPVFAYLDRRGYGSEGYASGWLTRRLDAMLARSFDFDSEKANMEAVQAYPAQYAEQIEALEAAINRLPAQRNAAIRRIKDSLDPEREILADALNDAAGVVAKFENARRAKADAVQRVSDSIRGADEESAMVTEAVVALLAKERASAALRGSSETVKAAALQVDALLKKRISVAKEVDGIRRTADEILGLLADIQNLLDADAGREVGAERFEFAIVSAGDALAEARASAA